MLPGDRLICAFVEPQTVGVQFRAWLLHVTVVPWFRLDDPSDLVASGLARALTVLRPFAAVMGDEAMFGPRKNRRVRLVTQPTPFTQVEAKVRAYLHKKRALLVDETTKRPPEFRPHVTMQDGVSLKQGDAFQCNRLYIVEQKGQYKEVAGKVILHE